MIIEKAYDFRKKLLTIHEKNIRNFDYIPKENELEIADGVIIEIGNTDNIVINTAAKDFIDFLATSMNVSATFSKKGENKGKNVIRLALAKDEGVALGEAEGYKGFFINVADGIEVFGYDDRGVAAALYYLEDLMTFAHAPYIKRGEIRKKPAMAPLMVHSGYGMEEWPDDYLSRIAHEGRDAILVFTTGINQTRVGYLDFNSLIDRAAKYGIDVYAYSFFKSLVHPDDEGAAEYYDSTYGELFRRCPGLRGVTMVGEVVEARSRDPHASKWLSTDPQPEIPDGKPWPGWYPCEEVASLMEVVKNAVRNVKPDADIVLWSYNWGFQPEEARIALINKLPTDITFEATFEMFDNKTVDGVTMAVSDYSLSYAGPGPYFTSEAIAAKKRGIRFYAMTQSAGVTWDFGMVPYEPMPYQWMRRYEGIRHAITEWNLCGSMDAHHHGFTPSIITKFSKHAFLVPFEPLDEILDKILISEYGEENLETVKRAFDLWSEGITHYVPSHADFTGPGRVGPAYPFTIYHKSKPKKQPEAMFGSLVVGLGYDTGMEHAAFVSEPLRECILNLRIHTELKELATFRRLMDEGIALFETIKNPNEKLCRMINLGKYIANCVTTNYNAKQFYILKCRMNAEFTKDGLNKILDEMEALLHAEIENARNTIPLVEVDSRLGWEPSMLYLGDREHLEWKIRQVEYVLNFEMVKLRNATNFDK